MNIFSPICPCCGKRTTLSSPNRKSLGARFGKNAQGISYFCGSYPKLLPYTVRPSSTYVDRGKPEHNIDLTHYYTYIRKYHIVIIHDMINMLNRFKVYELFNPKYAFRCRHCDRKLSINFNPFALCYSWLFVMLLGFSLTAIFASLVNIGDFFTQRVEVDLQKYVSILKTSGIVLNAALVSVGLYTSIGYAITRKFFSNIIPTEIYDDYVVPHTELVLDKSGLKRSYCHRGNILSAELDGEKIQLYVTDKKKRLSCHICGIDDEPRRIADILKTKLGKNIELFFEGKSIGTADILEFFDIPIEKPKTFYKPDLIEED